MRSFTTELGTASTSSPSSSDTGSTPLNDVSHTASETCSRKTSAQAFHRTSASSTCLNASPTQKPSTVQSTPVEKHGTDRPGGRTNDETWTPCVTPDESANAGRRGKGEHRSTECGATHGRVHRHASWLLRAAF